MEWPFVEQNGKHQGLRWLKKVKTERRGYARVSMQMDPEIRTWC
jgi:hypothetical protein